MDATKLETWAILELMGHRKLAGMITEQAIGGASFVRIDVPEIRTANGLLPAFTKMFSPSAIYAITPASEETARAFAAQMLERAFSLYEAPRLLARNDQPSQSPESLPDHAYDDVEDDEEDTYITED